MLEKPTPSYRWAAWSHWANVAFLAAAGVAGATIDPVIWLAALPVEALTIWLVPDLPPFRAAVDKAAEGPALRAERAYYIQQLWGLRPRRRKPLGARLAALFVAEDEVDDLDARIVQRTPESACYLEMREILGRLRAMVPLARSHVTERDVRLLESVVNGYLRLVLACRSLQRAVSELERAGLGPDLAQIHERLDKADAAMRPVLLERKRLLEAQLERAPKLRATLELLRGRAEALPHQLRSLHGQLLTEPSLEVHGALEDMLTRNDLLADPLGDLSGSDTALGALLESSAPAVAPRAEKQRVSG